MMDRLVWNKSDFTSQRVFDEEMKNFFSPPPFLGLSNFLENKQIFILDYLSNRYLITKTDKFNLLINKCIHKNAVLVEDESELKKDTIICPIHFWCYDLNGNLKRTPMFNQELIQERTNIKSRNDVFDWQNFLFSNKEIIKDLTK